MKNNWKRRIFIMVSLGLYYTDLASDIYYYFTPLSDAASTVILIIILLQPTFYLLYYILTLVLPVLCKDSTETVLSCTISLLFRAPLYAILCELKLMLTPLYTLVSKDPPELDRMKQSFLPYLLIHSLVQSLPMLIYQFILLPSLDPKYSIHIISPVISTLTVLYSCFILNLIRKMNTGGMNWIQKPKPTLQFYAMKGNNLID